MIDQIRENALLVIAVARRELQREVGFNAAGVEWLDGYIQRQHEQGDAELRDGLVSVLGSFLGESIIYSFGGFWSQDGGDWCVRFDSENATFPFSKVSRHLENGSGDSVLRFFTAIPVLYQGLTGSLSRFLTELWETGQIRISDVGRNEISGQELEQVWKRLQHFIALDRDSLPGTPPAVSRRVAEWAITLLYRACSYLVHRTQSADHVTEMLNLTCPERLSPSTCYSVDLVFRFLPDLYRLAAAASPSDRLTLTLAKWGREWPLSSVGIDFSNSVSTGEALPPRKFNLDPWWGDDCLRGLYLDRVLERNDQTRLTDPRVVEGIRTVLGNHPELSAKMAAAAGQIKSQGSTS